MVIRRARPQFRATSNENLTSILAELYRQKAPVKKLYDRFTSAMRCVTIVTGGAACGLSGPRLRSIVVGLKHALVRTHRDDPAGGESST